MSDVSSPASTTTRGQARRRAFLDAAQQVFLAQGLEAASVNDVVRLAGGSLATLYAQFGSKDGLFLAMFEDRIGHFLEPLREISGAHLPLREGLQQIGEKFMAGVLSTGGVAMYRIVLSEARTYPHLAERYSALGPERVRATVRAYIEERMEHGEVRRDLDADWTASYFAELLRARYMFSAITDPAFTITPEEIHVSVTRVVDILLNGLTPR